MQRRFLRSASGCLQKQRKQTDMCRGIESSLGPSVCGGCWVGWGGCAADASRVGVEVGGCGMEWIGRGARRVVRAKLCATPLPFSKNHLPPSLPSTPHHPPPNHIQTPPSSPKTTHPSKSTPGVSQTFETPHTIHTTIPPASDIAKHAFVSSPCPFWPNPYFTSLHHEAEGGAGQTDNLPVCGGVCGVWCV